MVDYEKEDKGRRKTRTCSKCGTTGLVWGRTVEGWRLAQSKADGDLFYPDRTKPFHACDYEQPKTDPDAQSEDHGKGKALGQTEGEGDGEGDPKEGEGKDDELGKILAKKVLPVLKDELNQMVDQAIKKIPPKETVIKIERKDEPQIELEGAHHPLLPTLIKILASGDHAFLVGPPGGGKTTAVRQAAEALKRTYGYISLNPQTSESRLTGYMDANGVYRATQFRKLYVEGGVFCIDEIDNASDNLLTTLNGPLENGQAAFPDGVFPRHQEFVAAATGNTAGFGGDIRHMGRRPLDAATLDRFVFLHWPYDLALEEKLTLAQCDRAAIWLEWVREVRKFAAEKHPRLVASPRASIRGAKMIQGGVFDNALDLADAVLFRGIDKDTRTAILKNCPPPKLEY